MSEGFTAIALLFLVPLFFVVMHFQVKGITEEIQRQVEKLGGQYIKIDRIWLDGDRNTYSFRVQFLDASGKNHKTKCKVRQGSKTIYWTTAPSELLAPHVDGDTAVQPPAPQKGNSPKEAVINDLYLENQKLKEEIARLKGGDSARRQLYRENGAR